MNDRAARRSLILAGQTLVARTPQKLYLSKQVMNVPAFAGDCANCTRASKRVQSPVWFRLRRVRDCRYYLRSLHTMAAPTRRRWRVFRYKL